MPIAFLQNMGWEWIVILVVALLIFGHKLPAMARGLGSSVGEFKKGIKDGDGGSGGSGAPGAKEAEKI